MGNSSNYLVEFNNENDANKALSIDNQLLENHQITIDSLFPSQKLKSAQKPELYFDDNNNNINNNVNNNYPNNNNIHRSYPNGILPYNNNNNNNANYSYNNNQKNINVHITNDQSQKYAERSVLTSNNNNGGSNNASSRGKSMANNANFNKKFAATNSGAAPRFPPKIHLSNKPINNNNNNYPRNHPSNSANLNAGNFNAINNNNQRAMNTYPQRAKDFRDPSMPRTE